MYCLGSLNDQFSLLSYLDYFIFLLSTFFCSLSYISPQSKILLPDLCLFFLRSQGFSPPECKHCHCVLMVFILCVDSATIQEWVHGQKDRYDHPSFPENIAVIRNIHRRLFCFSSQGNFGVHILLFIFQTYTVAKFLKALLDIIFQGLLL